MTLFLSLRGGESMSEDIYTHERVGQSVIFVDPTGKKHTAVVTADWSTKTFPVGALNVVYVSDDPTKGDTYGRQIERATSVPHKDNQSAFGYFWE